MILNEKEAEEFLEQQGFGVIQRHFITNENQIKTIKLPLPWVMKASGKKIIHKRKLGGVKLNIKSLEQAKQAFHKLEKIDSFEGAIIQPQINGQEIILGLKDTEEFGIVIMVGAGGSCVEEKADVSFRVCPITESDTEEMIKELKINIKNPSKVKNSLLQLSSLASRFPTIKEVDINPLFVNEQGAIVVDARLVK